MGRGVILINVRERSTPCWGLLDSTGGAHLACPCTRPTRSAACVSMWRGSYLGFIFPFCLGYPGLLCIILGRLGARTGWTIQGGNKPFIVDQSWTIMGRLSNASKSIETLDCFVHVGIAMLDSHVNSMVLESVEHHIT
jgi:hypothetical protein